MSRRALGLFAGGLDSLLAAVLLRRQGVEVECVYFSTGFGREGYERRCRERSTRGEWPPLEVIDVSASYLRQVVLEPRHGYGGAMNPTIDCRIFMLREAARIARRRGSSLVFTGDVLGQRAMEQSRSSLMRVDVESDLEGRVLRPLSARLLPSTFAEREGWVDREALERVHGRSRRRQLELARRFGVTGFPTPSGGCCRLAQPCYARRLRDQLTHTEKIRPIDLELLKRGRHFRLAWNLKVVLGRDEEENAWLEERAGVGWTCQVSDGRGALALVCGEPGDRLARVAALAVRYSKARSRPTVEVTARRGGEVRRVSVPAAVPAETEAWRI
jgi:tRNA U34 2-thiouridine synthase MnmA/TrmU